MIIDHIIGNMGDNWSTQKEWGGSSETTMMHLKSQVQQFGGFAHGHRVFGWAPGIRIGAVANPHFADFTNPYEAITTKTHHLHGIIRQIRQSPLEAYFNGKLKLRR